MKVLVVGLGVAALMTGSAAPAWANDAQVSRDFRCFSLLGPAAARMMRDTNPRVRAQGSKAMQAASYYLGRVDGAVPPDELAARMKRERAALAGADAKAETTRCREEMKAIEARFERVGADLKSGQ